MYSRDDVELALYALEEGMGARGAAELVGCGVTAVREWSRGHLPHSVAGCGVFRQPLVSQNSIRSFHTSA